MTRKPLLAGSHTRILAALRVSERPMTPLELSELTKVTHVTTRQSLRRLTRRGFVVQPWRGVYTVPKLPEPKPMPPRHRVDLVQLADRVARLVPSHRAPEAFFVERSEIEHELRRLAWHGRQPVEQEALR
jgi:hypothetical protein